MSATENSHRVLVLASIRRDSQLLTSFLRRVGTVCRAVANLDDLVAEVHRGAATAVVTEECLNGSSDAWMQRMLLQPVWSDFPMVILTGDGIGSFSPAKLASVRKLGNVTLLERPVKSESLLSAVLAAIKARERQYEIRDYMQRQADSQEALRRTEKLAVAGRLAASIAHEINNPLAAITNLLYLVGTSTDLEDAKKYCAIAQDEVRRVSEIANQTLRFYRAPAEPERTNASTLVDSALVLFRAKFANHDIKVERSGGENCELVCAMGEIRQVLVNLISNAIDVMNTGGSLCLRTSCLPHPATRVPGVRISVADQGTGIPAHVGKRIFEPFFTTKSGTGTGLGLWLSKDIVERSRGFIRWRNHHSPHGAVFSVWLPKGPAPVKEEPIEEKAA